jgi:competence protein ComEC
MSKRNVYWLFVLINLGFFIYVFIKNYQDEIKCDFSNICSLAGKKISGYGEIDRIKYKNNDKVEIVLANLKVRSKNKDKNKKDNNINNYYDKNNNLKIYEGKLIAWVPEKEFERFNYRFKSVVKFGGELEIPENFEDFDYRRYLYKDDIFACIYKIDLSLLNKEGSRNRPFLAKQQIKFINLIYDFKKSLNLKIQTIWQGEDQGLIKSLIIGDKSELSKENKEKFQKIGISHIIAISGMHLHIISEILSKFFYFLGFRKKINYFLIIIFLGFYVFLIGLPASAIRALIMTGFAFLAQTLGRKKYSNLILFFTLNMMLVFNYKLLFNDIGFQFSFLAVLALLNLMPLLERFFLKIKFFTIINPISEDLMGKLRLTGVYKTIQATFLATLSCQIMTLPLMLYYFNYFSLISILANLMIFWVVFPLIFGAIVCLILSFISVKLAGLIAFLPEYGVKYLLFTADYLSKF